MLLFPLLQLHLPKSSVYPQEPTDWNPTLKIYKMIENTEGTIKNSFYDLLALKVEGKTEWRVGDGGREKEGRRKRKDKKRKVRLSSPPLRHPLSLALLCPHLHF